MAARKRGGLGRGLDSLIPPEADYTARKENAGEVDQEPVVQKKAGKEDGESPPDRKEERTTTETARDDAGGTAYPVRMVRLTRIEPDRSQPRKYFDEDKLKELAESIRDRGMLEPILVQDRGDYYEIIAGERRWRAARLAGLKEVPVIVREYNEREKVEISLIENIQREDLNPIEEANAYRRLIEEFRLTQEEVAQKVSKNRTSVANSIRLLKLAEPVQGMLSDGRLSMGQARALISVEDAETQEQLARQIVGEGLNVREVEKLVRERNKKEPRKETRQEKETDHAMEVIYRDVEDRMNTSLGMKVKIKAQGDKSGRLEISFSSQDELEKLMDLLLQG